MPSLIPFTEDALQSIQRYLGKATADAYARFFSGKDEKSVVKAVEELLTDVLGQEKAEEEISGLLKKHRLPAI